MRQQRLWILIARQLTGEASEEDLLELNKAVEMDPPAAYQLATLLDFWEHSGLPDKSEPVAEVEKVWQKIQPALSMQDRAPMQGKSLKLKKGINGLLKVSLIQGNHFRLPRILLLSLAALSFILLTPATSFCRNSATHQNYSPGTDPLPDFISMPPVRWKFQTNQPILSSPVISENTVYVGGLDSVLYAMDVQTGKINWKYRTGGEIRSNALVNKNQVYLVGGDGILYSIDKISGKTAWKLVFNKTAQFLGERKYDLADYFNSSPVLYKEVIYFGSGDGRVNAVKAQNGELLWTFKTDDIVHATVAVDNDKVFAGSFDGNVYALNSNTGNLVWKFKSVGHEFFPKGEMQGSPVVFNGTVFIGGRDFNLYAINADGGYCNWNQKYPKGWALANSVRDSILYVATSEDKFIAAVDPSGGKELWRRDLQFNVFSPAVFSASMLYIGNLMGKVFGIDRRDGAIKWTFTTDGYRANHDKYFKADNTFSDQFYQLIKNNVDYINAQLKWGAVFSSPAISKNTLIITSTDGMVYCLGQ